MGFDSVFHSLHETFPQVDVRMLKAVAIEHSDDVDAAAEFVLLEVLPTISSHLADCRPDSLEDKYPSGGVESEEPNCLQNCHEVPAAPAGSCEGPNFPPIACTREDFGGAHQQTNSLYGQLTSLDDSSSDASVHSPSDPTSVDSESRVILPTHHHNTSAVIGSNQYSYTELISDPIVADENSSLLAHVQDLPCKPDVDHLVASSIGNLKSHSDVNSLEDETTLQNFHCQPFNAEEKYDLIDHVSTEGKNYCFSISEVNEAISTCSLEPQLTTPANSGDLPGIADAYHDSQINTATLSSQTSADYLEEFITNAKSNKKTLLSAMESMIDMVREVELQEKAAEQAKEEAAKGSLATLAKMEELKQMLEQAKEANAMYSGEVYGERAILATEVRELQARLINLSDERDRSLLIIDQMRQDLEARFAAAAREIADAERERQEKEESASKAYTEQKLIMEKLVEESKKIHQQAEENAKLREFLMDRGRVVDALQGEIAVICEDVKALKERIDGRLPVSKSLSSSQGSFVLASLSTFQKNVLPDIGLEMTRSSGSLKSLNQELLNGKQSSGTGSEGEENETAGGSSSGGEDNGKSSSKLENGNGVSLKAPSDDDWLLF